MVRLFFFMSMLALCTSCFRIPNAGDPGKSISLRKVSKLPNIAQEISGMVLTREGILFLNDGGGGNFLHLISEDGRDSISSFRIERTINRDWEALTRYENELIIGDFGNNLGYRKDLTIYHIDLETKKIKDSVNFAFPDQKVFDDPKHNFDCEAIVVKNDQYFLFSKNRGNKNANVYIADLRSSDVRLYDSISLEGMVTDACFHEASNSFILTCYQLGMGGFKNSLAIVKEKENGSLEVTNILNIGPAEQFESIVHIESNLFYLASENGFLGNGRHLYIVQIDGL